MAARHSVLDPVPTRFKAEGPWLVIGVDPGASGGLALIGSSGFADGRVLDTKSEDELERALDDLLESADGFYSGKVPSIKRYYVEDVHSMPGEGHVGVFSFGQSKGCPRGYIRGRFRGLRMGLVQPAVWQRHFFGAKIVGMDGDLRKEYIRRSALKRWPEASLERKKDEAVAAALYIADCGLTTQGW